MFANRPEICVATLFCEVMDPNESLIFIGFRKHFKNSGYGYTAEYAGL